ncbi:hypothetical protein ACFFRR_004757 [Megaselia abdita]
MLKIVVYIFCVISVGGGSFFAEGAACEVINNCKCDREVRVYGSGTALKLTDYKDIIPIKNLTQNKALPGEILRTRLFYQGHADFSVAFLEKDRQPLQNDIVFQTMISYGAGLHESSMFLTNIVEEPYSENHPRCDRLLNQPGKWETFEARPIDVVINKDYNLILWYLGDGIGNKPFMSCYHPNVGKVQYIAFNGWDLNNVRYLVDCVY